MAFDNDVAMFNENVGAVYNAVEFRRQFQSHNVNLPGRMRVGDFAVTGVGPNVAVADGAAYIGSTTAARGQWFARSTTDAGTTAVAVTNNPGPGARTDIVTIRVNDSAYSGAANTVVIAIETGVTVSGFDQAMILAEISVAAGGTTVTSITDRRRFAGTYQGISRVTSATRPAAPNQGDFIYETDTNKLQQYTTATTLWTPPWNMPWGVVGRQALTSINSTSGPHTTLQNGSNVSTVTLTTVTNRIYRMTTGGVPYASGGNNGVVVAHLVGGTEQNRFQEQTLTIAADDTTFYTSIYVETAGGSRIFKTQLKATGANTQVDIYGDAAFLRTITIEDIGPSGAPA